MACITKKRGRTVIDFYDQHGNRRLKTLAKGITRTEARKELNNILKQVEHRTYLPDRRVPSFSDVADDWLKQKKLNVRRPTYDHYEGMVRLYFKPFFGETKITRVNYDAVTKYIAKEVERGASVYHLRKSIVLLSGIMKYAVRQRYIDYNPVNDVEKPKGASRQKQKDEMEVLGPEEIKALLDHTEGQEFKTLFMLAVMSGARQGELIGLKWTDLDWFNSQIAIRRTFQHGTFYEPKSPASKRKIDLGPTVMAQLKEWKIACPPTDLDLIFPSETGTPLDNNNLVRRHFDPALRRTGLRKIRFHDLRHSYASLLIEQGEHPKYIQSQMGHSSINVTMDVYGHLMNTVNQTAARRLDSAVFEKNGDNLETEDERSAAYKDVTR
ncbi:MAG: tyrosine-type recombinase/integrase [Desulfatiglandales bacterium]